MFAPDKQQIEGLKFVVKQISIEDFNKSIDLLLSFCLTKEHAQLLISRFKLIKMGII